MTSRAILIAGVAGTWQTAAIKAAARAAAAAAAWSGTRQDAAALAWQETGQAAMALPLWPNGENPLAVDWQNVRAAWAATNDPGWHFWIDWYDSVVEGRPLLGDWDRNWAQLTDIALIDPDIWDKGPSGQVA